MGRYPARFEEMAALTGQQASRSASRSMSASRSASKDASRSKSASASMSASASLAASLSALASDSTSRSQSREASVSRFKSASVSASGSRSASASLAASLSELARGSQSRSRSQSQEASSSRSRSISQKASGSRSVSMEASGSRSRSMSRSASVFASASQSRSVSKDAGGETPLLQDLFDYTTDPLTDSANWSEFEAASGDSIRADGSGARMDYYASGWASQGIYNVNDVGQADYEVRIPIAHVPTGSDLFDMRVYFRFADVSNCCFAIMGFDSSGNCRQLRIFKVVSSVQTSIADTGVISVAAEGETLIITNVGNSMTATLGAGTTNVSDAANAGNQKVGMRLATNADIGAGEYVKFGPLRVYAP